MENLYSMLNRKQVLGVVGNQWGDEGKGKFVDLFSAWADIIVRGTGGGNAGHTIVVGKEKKSFHLVPSGILRGDKKINIMGKGMVIDLGGLSKELRELEEEGLSYEKLRISERAHLVLPYHKEIDKLQDKVLGLGTTGQGVGAAYADKTARIGIIMGDLKDKEGFVKKLKEIKKIKETGSQIKIGIERIVEEQYKYYEKIKELVCDTDGLLRKERKMGRRVLLEGAQGLLLSLEYGTYPFVTSCDCSRYGLAKGAGLRPEEIDMTLGIVKFPFMTRVGNGPFPTEYGGRDSERYCGEGKGYVHTKEEEEAWEMSEAGRARESLLNEEKDPFMKGVGLRLTADEYGATTGRPRRIGRTDLVALKYAMEINGCDIILTKLDCVRGMEEIELGVGYAKGSKEREQKEIGQINQGAEIAYGWEGRYRKFDGYEEDIKCCRHFKELPAELMEGINFVAERTGARIRAVSTGAGREQVLVNTNLGE